MSDCVSLEYDSLFGQISSLEDTFGCASTAYLTCSSTVLFLVSSDLPAYITHLPRATIYHLVRLWRASGCSLLQCWSLDTSWNNLSSVCISLLTQHLNSSLHRINWSSIRITWLTLHLNTGLHLRYCCIVGGASWLLRLRCFLFLLLLLDCRTHINAFKIEPLIKPLCLISGVNIIIRHALTM